MRLLPFKLTQTNADTAEDEKVKDEASKAWLCRPVVGSTHEWPPFKAPTDTGENFHVEEAVAVVA